MNLLIFLLMITIPYQGTNGTLALSSGVINYPLGEYNPNTKEVYLDYTCIYNIGNTYFDFGQVTETTTARDNGFNFIYLSISDIVIVSPASSVAIYQAKHTYFYSYTDTSRNYTNETLVHKQITNPIESSFTINSDNSIQLPLLSYSNDSYEQGYTFGYEIGYDRGHDIGYESGAASGNGVNNVISWFGNVWNALTNFLSLEIAPNLKIGTIITIPIVVGVLFFVLKALIQ